MFSQLDESSCVKCSVDTIPSQMKPSQFYAMQCSLYTFPYSLDIRPFVEVRPQTCGSITCERKSLGASGITLMCFPDAGSPLSFFLVEDNGHPSLRGRPWFGAHCVAPPSISMAIVSRQGSARGPGTKSIRLLFFRGPQLRGCVADRLATQYTAD